jgi:hypothetical protein
MVKLSYSNGMKVATSPDAVTQTETEKQHWLANTPPFPADTKD